MTDADAEEARGIAQPEVKLPFPRGLGLPSQSPLFWVAEKDRYLRQLLIRDIEAQTGRDLIVYVANCDSGDAAAQIHPSDDAYLVELLRSPTPKPVDLLIETNGGFTDATEKFVAILRTLAPDLRVIVPRRAKSNGTLVALAAGSILMGPSSELGPIDPFLNLAPGNSVPARFIQKAPNVDPIIKLTADMAVAQTTKLATSLLESGMMKGRTAAEIAAVVEKLSTRDHFHSHGSVIDAVEAADMGLKVEVCALGQDLWDKLWLLRCMYAHDMKHGNLIKIFEGRFVSNSFKTPAP